MQKGQVVNEPVIEWYGYTFLGWYLGNDLYDFNVPVTGDITLVAKWSKNPVTSLRIDALASVSMKRGTSFNFDVIVNDGALDDDVTWHVSNPLYATVDDSGFVKILNKTGTVILTATAPSGLSHSIILRIT